MFPLQTNYPKSCAHYSTSARSHFALLLTAVLAVVISVSTANVQAQGVGDLLVVPTRIVFEGSKRTAEVTLLNIGAKPATYRISFIHQKMTEEGKLEEILKPDDKPQYVDDLVRFTPRQVLLEPNVSQVIRLQLRLPEELKTGEYRSHLLLRAVPVADSPPVAVAPGAPEQGLSIKITPIYGVSIPVIVRHGKTSATASLSNLKLETDDKGVVMVKGRMNREGNRSLYGDMQFWFAPNGGASKQIGLAGGVAIYTSNTIRSFAFRVTPPAGGELRKGTLRVFYRQQADEGGALIAESTLTLP